MKHNPTTRRAFALSSLALAAFTLASIAPARAEGPTINPKGRYIGDEAVVVIELTKEQKTMLFDFSTPDAAKLWQTVNDGVMGGVSDGKVRITETNLEFYGTLSLENNGGFASVRSNAAKMDLSRYDGLVFKVRGDGRDYYLNIHVPTSMIAFWHQANFKTEKDKWTEVRIPFTDLKATSFGRVVENYQPFNPSKVEAVGFLLTDKKAGPFKLEVAWIKGIPKAGK